MDNSIKNNILKYKKYILVFLMLVILLISVYVVPTLARYKNRIRFDEVSTWNGTVATSYRSGNGSAGNPYVISNGSELAYFLEQSKNNNYENTYFMLSNDIILNDGLFIYDENIKYIKDENTYYINNDSYYLEDTYDTLIGSVNLFGSINNFKGNFNGDFHTIFGLYINENENYVSLFNNLEGNIENLYIENSLVNGGKISSILSSSAINSTISNVVVDGYVITDSNEEVASVIEIQDYTNTFSSSDEIKINYNLESVMGITTSTILKGTLEIDGDASIKINDVTIEEGNFEIDLGSNIKDIILSVDPTIDTTINLTNLEYIVDYDKSISSGIVAYSKNTIITNCINKADVYSNKLSGGIIGLSISSTIKNSYNTGNINSNNLVGGLVGYILSGDNIITNSYNTGIVNSSNIGSIVNYVNNSNLTIRNVFNSDNSLYAVNTSINSNITVYNSYTMSNSSLNEGNLSGIFENILAEQLSNREYMIDNLYYNEFISDEDLIDNSNNIWIYNANSLPILYIDDINDPKVILHAGKYSWNDLGFDLDTYNFNDNITFMIESYDSLNPMSSIYYYLSTEKLNNSEIKNITDWNEYTEFNKITLDGKYIIYVKAIDYLDNVYYINSDELILDNTNPEVEIKLNDQVWDTYNDELEYIYLDSEVTLTINAEDILSGIKSIKYYVTDNQINFDSLNNITEWIDYSNNIKLDTIGNRIIYVEVIDNCNNKVYLNTDYLVINGYNMTNIISGINGVDNLNHLSITDKSQVSFIYEYNDSNGYLGNYTHNISSSIMLPINTVMTLIDLNTNEVYKYKTTNTDYNYDSSDRVLYPLSMFKNIKVSTDEYFSDSSYYMTNVSEKFKLIIDFSETNITENYSDVEVLMVLNDENQNKIVPTLNNTIKKFNIYTNSYGESYMNSTYNGSGIIYNTNSSNKFSISTGITNKYINGEQVIDTKFENMKLGIEIKILDSDNNILDKKYLKNISIKIDDVLYYPEGDGTYRIKVSDSLTSIVNAEIIIKEDNVKLKSGNYKLRISNIISYDGIYSKENYSNIEIPLIVTENINNIYYKFEVNENASYRVINKNEAYKNLSYSIIKKGWMLNPNIRVSLYKKESLSAYNQDYIRVNLNNYVSNSLESTNIENVYYVTSNPKEYYGTSRTLNNFELTILPNTLENTEYKLVFELYNGNDCISTINKYFIVK